MRSAVGAVAAIAVLLGISAMAAGASGTDRAERPSTESSSLSSAEAVVLGIVEGVTEYLPVSSTGHLLITERLMGIGTSGDADKNAADSYTIAIQIGAIVAVLGIYRRRFVTMIDGVLGRSDEGRSVLMSLLAAFVPAAIIGQIFGDAIKDRLLSPWPVAAAWLVGGVGILVFVGLQSRLTTSITSLAQITPRHALIIGVAHPQRRHRVRPGQARQRDPRPVRGRHTVARHRGRGRRRLRLGQVHDLVAQPARPGALRLVPDCRRHRRRRDDPRRHDLAVPDLAVPGPIRSGPSPAARPLRGDGSGRNARASSRPCRRRTRVRCPCRRPDRPTA